MAERMSYDEAQGVMPRARDKVEVAAAAVLTSVVEIALLVAIFAPRRTVGRLRPA